MDSLLCVWSMLTDKKPSNFEDFNFNFRTMGAQQPILHAGTMATIFSISLPGLFTGMLINRIN